MKGRDVKKKLEIAGYSCIDKDLALKIGMKKEALERVMESEDVKTSFLEKANNNLHLSPEYFFADENKCESILGNIVVNTKPLVMKELQYELNIKLEEGEELKYLTIVSITIPKEGGRSYSLYTPDTYHQFEGEIKSGGGTIYFLFKDEERCAIRYVDEEKTVHEQYIGEHGLRITIESSGRIGEFNLMLFKNKKELKCTKVTFNSFENGFKDIWFAYECEENNSPDDDL